MPVLLFSCEGVKVDHSILERSIRVNAHIKGMQTRASNTTWDANDAIGIYMVVAGQPLSSESILAKNAKYITSGDGFFSPSAIAHNIKFPLEGSNVNLIAYYPHGTVSSSLTRSIDVSDQSSQATIDILYSNSGEVLNRNSPNVSLPFSHKLSKIEVIIKNIDNSPLTDVTATLKGCKIRGSLSLTDGTISTTSTKGNIRMKVADNGAAAEAIVLPTETLSGITLTITNGDYGYVYNLNSAVNITQFESGYKYSYTITLDTRSPLIASAVISDWITGPSEEATILKDFEVYNPEGAGTEQNPYTITDARNLSPHSNVWVKGFIVGYYSGVLSSFTNSATRPATDFSALALATSADETTAANTYPVQVPSGALRVAINNEYEANFRKEILVKGNIADYYGTTGLTSLSEYKFVTP